MKNIKKSLLFGLFTFFITFGLFAQDRFSSFTVENNLDILRSQETISINLKRMDNPSNIIVAEKDGNVLVSQLIDNDQDGKPDELIFQDDFKANENKTYHLKISSKKEETKSKVYSTVVKGREDIAWESDKIAFRMYGPPLAKEVNNGIDVWAKSVDYLIVDKWYKEEEEGIKSYHIDGGEGADFFSVGKSLGDGGSALYVNGKLYQSGVYKHCKILTNGPIRTKFKLTYEFNVDGKTITEEKAISIDAGSNMNRIETQYSLIPKDVEFAAGLVKRANTSVAADFSNGIISLWGDISEKKSDGELGTSVIFPFGNNVKIMEDSTHVLITSDISSDDAIVYYAGAGWTKRKDFLSQKDWINYLKEYSLKIKNPLVVNFIK